MKALLILLLLLTASEAGTLTNRDGKEIEAVVLSGDASKVRVLVAGKEYDIPMQNLSEASQKRVGDLLRLPAAWGRTRWGMTVEQIREAYPEAVPCVPAIDYGKERRVPLQIRGFEIAGVPFDVRFIMEGGRLVQVVLSRENEDVEGADSRMRELLVARFGGTFRMEKTELCQYQTWNLETMTVRLCWGTIGGMPSLRVVYSEISGKELEKL